MANSRHLKRTSMPISWPVQRKLITFISRPVPGSYNRKYVVSLTVLLRDILKIAKTSKEVKFIVHNKEVLVNGKEVSESKYACGMFDIVEIKSSEEKFTILFDEFGKVRIIPVKDNLLYLKVSSKTIASGKKYQINFMNGYNIFVDEKTFKSVKVNDTIIYDYKSKKVSKTVPLKEGSFTYIFDGKYKGKFGEVKSFVHFNGVAKDTVQVQIADELHTTAKDYCFAIGLKKEDLKRFE